MINFYHELSQEQLKLVTISISSESQGIFRLVGLRWYKLAQWASLNLKGSSSGQGSYAEPNSNEEMSKESKEKCSKLNLPLKKA